jgi:hypothetical protein
MQGWSRWFVVVVSSSSVDLIICYDGYLNVEHVICMTFKIEKMSKFHLFYKYIINEGDYISN